MRPVSEPLFPTPPRPPSTLFSPSIAPAGECFQVRSFSSPFFTRFRLSLALSECRTLVPFRVVVQRKISMGVPVRHTVHLPASGSPGHEDLDLLRATINRERCGFLSAGDVAKFASDPLYRTTGLLIRWHEGRALVPAYLVDAIIRITASGGGWTVRDVSFPAETSVSGDATRITAPARRRPDHAARSGGSRQ